MRRILLLSFLASTVTYGQITLSESNFQQVNEEFIFSTTADLTVDFVTTGQNQTWDFSNLVPTDQRGYLAKPMSLAGLVTSFYFGSFAPVEYQASYFNTSVDFPIAQFTSALPITIDDISLFTRNATNGITSVGYELVLSGQPVGVKSDTIETRYELPMTFGDNYSSRGYSKLNMNPIYDIQWIQHRQRQTTVDGFGTVITPHGTYQALRIHHIINEIDSFYLSLNGAGTWITLPIPIAHEYEWRSTSDHEAVMRIRTSEIAGNETPTTVEYRDDYNGLGVNESTIQITCTPNPTTDFILLSSLVPQKEWIVVDATGKVVYRHSNECSSFNLDVTTFSNGTYTVLGVSESGVSSMKFIKQ